MTLLFDCRFGSRGQVGDLACSQISENLFATRSVAGAFRIKRSGDGNLIDGRRGARMPVHVETREERLALGLIDTLDVPPRARWPLDEVAAAKGAALRTAAFK